MKPFIQSEMIEIKKLQSSIEKIEKAIGMTATSMNIVAERDAIIVRIGFKEGKEMDISMYKVVYPSKGEYPYDEAYWDEMVPNYSPSSPYSWVNSVAGIMEDIIVANKED
jgi:hypothetical protein